MTVQDREGTQHLKVELCPGCDDRKLCHPAPVGPAGGPDGGRYSRPAFIHIPPLTRSQRLWHQAEWKKTALKEGENLSEHPALILFSLTFTHKLLRIREGADVRQPDRQGIYAV